MAERSEYEVSTSFTGDASGVVSASEQAATAVDRSTSKMSDGYQNVGKSVSMVHKALRLFGAISLITGSFGVGRSIGEAIFGTSPKNQILDNEKFWESVTPNTETIELLKRAREGLEAVNKEIAAQGSGEGTESSLAQTLKVWAGIQFTGMNEQEALLASMKTLYDQRAKFSSDIRRLQPIVDKEGTEKAIAALKKASNDAAADAERNLEERERLRYAKVQTTDRAILADQRVEQNATLKMYADSLRDAHRRVHENNIRAIRTEEEARVRAARDATKRAQIGDFGAASGSIFQANIADSLDMLARQGRAQEGF